MQFVFLACEYFFLSSRLPTQLLKAGFPPRRENRENENGQGKVREQAKMTKSQGIL